MSRPLTPSERNLRMNIRNAFLIATPGEFDKEIELRTNREDFLAVRFLKELRDELDQEKREQIFQLVSSLNSGF